MKFDGFRAWLGRTHLLEGHAGASQFMVGGLRGCSGEARTWTPAGNEMTGYLDGDLPKPLGI